MVPAVAAATPGLAWTAFLLWLGVSAAVGRPLFSSGEPLTLSEAAALRDQAEILRQVRRGTDPNAPAHVRRDVLRSLDYTMTPLEAAIGASRVDILRLLTDLGAVVHEGNYPRLWCFAQVRGDKDVIAFIEARLPGRAPVDCSAVKTPW